MEAETPFDCAKVKYNELSTVVNVQKQQAENNRVSNIPESTKK